MSQDKDLIALEQRRKKDLAQLHDPTISAQDFMAQQTERRKRLEAKAAEDRAIFEQNRANQIAEKTEKQKHLALEKMLKSETKVQKSARLERDRVKQLKRDNEIADIEKEKQDVKDEITTFFDNDYEPSSNYNESPVNKIILFREMGIDQRLQETKYAYRCKVCMYNKEESLSLITIERHIHESKNHKEALLSTIEKDYTNVVKEKQNEWLREDSDPSYKNQKIDRELAALKGIKTVTPG